jgi:hypothetical protein
VVFPGCCAETQEDPREVVDPVRRGAAGVLHYCCSGGDRYLLGPTGGSVNDGEQVGKTFGCRQGAHHVHVDVAESAGGYRDVLRRYLHMAVDLGTLAAQASLRPGGNICGETFPHIPGGDERRVARQPGWAVLWRCSKTCRRRSLSTSGRNVLVDESPMRSRSPTFCVMMHSPGLERRACTCGQRIWRRAISLRSRGDLSAMAAQARAVPATATAGRDRTSATTLDVPGTYTS